MLRVKLQVFKSSRPQVSSHLQKRFEQPPCHRLPKTHLCNLPFRSRFPRSRRRPWHCSRVLSGGILVRVLFPLFQPSWSRSILWMEICFVQQWQAPGRGEALRCDTWPAGWRVQGSGGWQRVGINGLRRREVMLSGCRENTHFYAGGDSAKNLWKWSCWRRIWRFYCEMTTTVSRDVVDWICNDELSIL